MPTTTLCEAGFDGRFIGTGTGLSRYSSELLAALLAQDEPRVRWTVLVRDRDAWPHLPTPHRVVVADVAHYSIGEQVRLPRLIRRLGLDVFLAPHFNVPVLTPVPTVVTVHDLILHRHPGGASLPKRLAYRAVIARAVRAAAAVVAVSRWTADDLAREYGPAVAGRTHVIGEGVAPHLGPRDEAEVSAVRARFGLPDEYVLYVGNAKPHKNVPSLIEAWRRSGTDASLVLVGCGELTASDLPERAVRVTGLSDEELAALYTGAQALVTMSLEEGFCLPVAEALACGCPVIASDLAAIPETSGGHALLLPPDVDRFAAAIADPPGRTGAVRVGDWAETARAVEDLVLTTAGVRAT